MPLIVPVAVAGAWAFAAAVLPRGLPLGVVVLGLVYGSFYSLSAVGLVLIYRSSRVVNFAQAQLGLLGGTVTALLAAGHGLNFYLSVFLGLLVAGLTGALTHVLVIHRLRRSSRVLVAVATIGLAQALTGFQGFVPSIVCGTSLFGRCSFSRGFNFPLTVKFTINPVIFNGADVVTLVSVAGVLLVMWAALRFTYWGKAMRGSAENRERAVLLGIRVFPIDMSVWIVAAMLSAVTLVLYTGVYGYSPVPGVPSAGDDILLRVLAAAVIGGMESIPRTVLAALFLGVYDAGATWTSANLPFVDATLVVIIVVALLLQHRRFTRSGDGLGANWLTVRQFKPVPRVLSRLPEVRWARRLAALAIVFLLIYAPHMLPIGQVYLLAPLLVYGIVGLSLLILSGWAGQISLGQFGLAGLGGAVAGFLVSHSWNWLGAIAIGILAAAAAAFLIGLPALRIRGPFLAVTTFAFAVAMYEYILPPQWFPSFVAQSVNRPTPFGHNLFGSDSGMYYLCVAVFVVVAVSLWSLRRSAAGRSLIATRDNETAAEAIALPTTRIRLTAFVLSGAVAGLAGALFVMDQGGVFYGAFSPDTSVLLFTMAVVGGLGSLSGVVFGVFYIWGVQYLLPPNWGILVSGLGIVILLLFLPEGLAGLFNLARDGVLRRIAIYRGLDVPELLPPDTGRAEPEEVAVLAPAGAEGLVG